ncbi:hypothetical protein QJS10_CPB20g01847 [Acorus calamus]|uniref:5'-3' DNA helicase ZGRF1-like N-terminal domain-containing protein n=1 Tax=Acorus calamus TaxID=4465 RepID=A0AAV9CBN2_ACOCL|nr:hypothetical protein QJS10_CPB20g01847 [Acorus calamus]
MADIKRWTVTYTRHLTQKRKVYQDGMLELHCSSNKVTLYSDTEEAIANRYLKKDEVVKSGSTLAFDAYLVDVADPDVRTKPLKENGPCVEWHSLYTTQKTQKAKRYHDGFLQIEACGLRMNQVTLKNEEGDVLGSKYFRSDEGIKTGGTCEFANYLVQIGEPRTTLAGETQKDSSSGQVRVPVSRNSNIDMSTSNAGVPRENALQNEQGKNKSKNSRTPFSSPVANPGAIKGNLKHKFDSCEASKCHPDSTQAVLKGNLKNKFDSCEASKCHPDSTQAVLKGTCGSYLNQVILTNEDGEILGSKYFKSSEHVKTGGMCELPNYLVEIGEPRTTQAGDKKSAPPDALTDQSNSMQESVRDN